MLLPILLASCVHLDALPDRPTGPVTLVFFATWCPACRDSLATDDRKDVILVGTLDERERLERAYAQLGKGRACILDEDGQLLRRFGGKDVPFEATVTLTP